MDIAWCETLGGLVTDYSLYLIDPDRQNEYRCCRCYVKVIPCATVKGQYKKKPYFKLLPKTTHEKDCEYYKDDEVSINSLLATIDIASLPIPQVFTLRKDNQTTSGASGAASEVTTQQINASIATQNPERTSHERKHTTSFQRVVDAYAINPAEISRVGLKFQGIDGDTYGQIFHTISYYNKINNVPKVFWGEMSWKMPLQEETNIQINLNCGLWENKIMIKNYKLYIDTQSWEPQQINQFLTRYERARDCIKGNKQIKGYIAFVGRPNQSDEFIFHAENYQLIATTIPKNLKQGASSDIV